jgi:hypothetical protein
MAVKSTYLISEFLGRYGFHRQMFSLIEDVRYFLYEDFIKLTGLELMEASQSKEQAKVLLKTKLSEFAKKQIEHWTKVLSEVEGAK